MVFKKKKSELDLNNDGKFDEKDKKLAGKVLATKLPEDGDVVEEKEEVKEDVKEEEKEEGCKQRIAKCDISLTYRKGSVVPEEQIEKWKKSGINWEVWFN